MTIQMKAASEIQNRRVDRRGSQRVRPASYASKKYSKVLGKMRSHGPDLGLFEDDDADQAVVVEEPADVEGRLAYPVAMHAEVGHRQVVHVECLVVRLVPIERQAREGLEDGLVEPVDDQRGQHRREWEPEHAQRHEHAGPDDRPEDDRASDHSNRVSFRGRGYRAEELAAGRPPVRVYTPRQLNGRSATWVTPTFLFERRFVDRWTQDGGDR